MFFHLLVKITGTVMSQNAIPGGHWIDDRAIEVSSRHASGPDRRHLDLTLSLYPQAFGDEVHRGFGRSIDAATKVPEKLPKNR